MPTLKNGNKIQRNKIKSNKTSPQLKMANKAKKVQDKVQHVEYYSKRGTPTTLRVRTASPRECGLLLPSLAYYQRKNAESKVLKDLIT